MVEYSKTQLEVFDIEGACERFFAIARDYEKLERVKNSINVSILFTVVILLPLSMAILAAINVSVSVLMATLSLLLLAIVLGIIFGIYYDFKNKKVLKIKSKLENKIDLYLEAYRRKTIKDATNVVNNITVNTHNRFEPRKLSAMEQKIHEEDLLREHLKKYR